MNFCKRHIRPDESHAQSGTNTCSERSHVRKLAILAASALGFGTAVVLAQTDSAIAGVQAPHEAQMVAMGDHHLYMNCMGRGRPTVMMEAGYGDASDVWQAVQPTLAAFTRVCVYDRAGLGRSEAVGHRTVQEVADDLSALLDATIAGPVVLVGHSVGGLLANMVAHRRPSKVTVLVLVDSSHPDQVARLRRNLPRSCARRVKHEQAFSASGGS